MSGQLPEHRATVGVLFVHGIGTQPRGRTLAEFAGPLVTWLQGWYDGLHARWVGEKVRFQDVATWLDAVRLPDPRRDDAVRSLLDRTPPRQPGETPADLADISQRVGDTLAVAVRLTGATGGQAAENEPSHVRLELVHVHLDEQATTTRTAWLLAEAWWAETFAPPSFGDLARWGLGVLPRTIGSHLGVRVHRAAGRWRDERSAWSLAVLLGRFGVLLLGLFASLPALALLGLMLLVGLLPIPSLRNGLRRLQQRISASLGDSYVLVTRPVEAAAIVGRVRRDLAWLAEQCDQVVVVAHSQGGAVLNEVLRQELAAGDRGLLGPPDDPDSPVATHPAQERRGRLRLLLTFGSGLRKLDELRRLLGPGVSLRRSALLTLAGLVVFTLSVLAIAVEATGPNLDTTVGVLAVYAIVGGVLLVAGLADLIADPSPGELRWWIGIFKQTGVRWRDYAASADPVPNGALLDEQCPFPEHRTVHNRGSLLRDHTTYWTNRDEFVVEVVRCLAELDPLVAPDLAGHDEDFAFARRRRRWRVAWLTGARWVAVAGIMAALVHKWAQWLPLAGQVPGHLAASAGIGTRPDTVELDETAIALWPAAAILAAYLLVGMFWRTLDRAETDRLLARRRPVAQAAEFGFVLGLDVLVLVAVWAAAPVIFSGWLSWAVVVGQLVLWFATQTRMRAYAPSDKAPDEHEARGVRAGRTLWGLFSVGLTAFGLAWLAWSAWRWQPVAGAVLAALILWGTLAQVRSWRRSSERPAQSTSDGPPIR